MEYKPEWKCVRRVSAADKLFESGEKAGELALENAYSETITKAINQLNENIYRAWEKVQIDIRSFLYAMCDVSEETIKNPQGRFLATLQDDGSWLISLDGSPLMYYTITESEKENGEYSLTFSYHLKMWRADVQESQD